MDNSAAPDDVSALAWVQEELRKSLETAHKALRRTLKGVDSTFGELESVDPAMLRSARTQLHQGAGALDLVRLPAAAAVLRASEGLVQRFVGKPTRLDEPTFDAIQQGSFAVLDFMTQRIAGRPVSPVALFPQYRVLQELAGAQRIHPADLWSPAWQWPGLPPEDGIEPRAAEPRTTAEFESQVLGLMRNPGPEVSRQLGDLSAALAAGAGHPPTADLWRLAAAFFEAQAQGLVPADIYSKRAASRLLAQLRGQQRDARLADPQLAHDLAFFCAHAGASVQGPTPRLDALRPALPDGGHALPVDYQQATLGRYDPVWVTQARKRVSTARDTWSAVAGGEMHRLTGLNEQFSLVADSLKRLVQGGETLGDVLSRAAMQAVQAGAPPAPALAMEVATSVLYLEAALEDGAFSQPLQAERFRRLAQRITSVQEGERPEPLEDWMEDLYRQVSDRQTMGSVVQELRGSLSESEKLIDQFFRAPGEASVLVPVPGQLQAMRGVLSVLGLSDATQAVLRMRDDVDALLLAGQTGGADGMAAERPRFDRLAANLSALSFLIDLLGVQPQSAKALFRYDPLAGLLQSLIGRRSAEPDRPAAPEAPKAPAGADGAVMPESPAPDAALALAAPRPDLGLDFDLGLGLPLPAQSLADAAEQAAGEPEELTFGLAPAAPLIDLSDLVSPLPAPAMDAFGEPTPTTPTTVTTAPEAPPAELQADAEPLTVAPSPSAAPAAMPAFAAATAPTPVEDEDGDEELREIFLEEAAEVIEAAREASAALKLAPDDVEQLTIARRAFHTLKGSSRMVGLFEFGEAAWAFEQLYNTWLAGHRPASSELLQVTTQALDHLEGWSQAIAAGRAGGRRSAEARRVADALRLEGRQIAFEPPTGVGAAVPVLESSPEFSEVAAGIAPEVAQEALEIPAAELVLEMPASPEGVEALEVAETSELIELADVSEFSQVFGLGSPDRSAAPGDLGSAMALRRLDLPSASDLELTLDAGEASLSVDGLEPQPSTQPVEPASALPGMDFSFDLGEPPAEEPAPAGWESGQGEGALPEAEPEPAHPPSPAVLDLADVVELEGLIDLGADLASEVAAGPVTEVAAQAAQAADIAGLPVADEQPAGDTLSSGVDAVQPETEEPLDEQVKRVGPLEISIPLFNIYLNEADELSRRLATELSEWALELHRPVGETATALAHSLAGSSAAVGFADLSALARMLEHTLEPSHALGSGTPEDAALFNEVADEVRRLLHQFAAGFLKSPPPELLDRLHAHGVALAQRLQAQGAAAAESAPEADPDADLGADESVDLELFAFFEEEAQDLLPEVAARLGDWLREPGHGFQATACLRALHTLKGGARLSGALRLGERAHRLEASIEQLLAGGAPHAQDIEALLGRADGLSSAFEACRRLAAQGGGGMASPIPPEAPSAPLPEEGVAAVPATETEPPVVESLAEEPALLAPRPEEVSVGREPVASAPGVPPTAAPELPLAAEAEEEPVPEAELKGVAAAEAALIAEAEALSAEGIGLEPLPEAPAPAPALPIDWSPFLAVESARPATPAAERVVPLSSSAVRVRAQLLDRMVNQAGEVSIARARLASGLSQFRSSLGDLTENLERLRQQLRDIEIQADTQISARMEAAKATSQAFDPLEFDRFTRFQELTRFMAESVNDVATVQRSLQRTLDGAEDQIAAQARLTRDLQDDLLRTRMVEFDGLAERLQRVVRQAAKETGKQARLEVVGGSIEVDRAVLDRMVASFEHLLRNAVTHGIEAPPERLAAGKDETGLIRVSLHQEGNEVSVEIRDDGAGLNLARIRARAAAMGLLDESQPLDDSELAHLIFRAGLSTADSVTELAGRGIGMDVVRHEVNALGGRIETTTTPGQGSCFRLVLPLTTAVTQVVMLRCGGSTIAVPSTLVEIVRRATAAEIEGAHARGVYEHAGQSLPFFWLGALLENGARSAGNDARSQMVVVVRSAAQRVALHVDEVLGNQEVVVKNLGPQLSRLPGLAGISLLPSGAVALIYNPVALATVYAETVRAVAAEAPQVPQPELPAPAAPVAPVAPLVLVVDDSLTVRRVTQRLLLREGYRVALAKDGLDALERLAEERPAVVLSDIEMPRMDGFDLLRNIRADVRLAGLPVIMITSRIAQKHRDVAAELGADQYLGKPYGEDELLGWVAKYCARSDAQAEPA